MKWIIYDAREESLSSAEFPAGPYLQVRRGIGGTDSEEVEFNILAAPSASSLLRPAPTAENYTLIGPDGRAQVWGNHSKVTKTVRVTLSTLDHLIHLGEVPAADFLSIDAQGAELSIFEGGATVLRDRVVGTICEVEFAELYDCQPLFCDIQARLRRDNFRLCEIYSSQYFNTAPLGSDLQGKGFLTVGEALFLRESEHWPVPISTETTWPPPSNVIQLIKLAAVAVAFDQLDYALEICRVLENLKAVSLDELAAKTRVPYLRMLRELMRASEENRSANRLMMEQPEGVASQMVLLSARTVTKVGLTLIGMVLAAAVRKLARNLTGRKSTAAYVPVARILYSYGFRDLAFKHAVRAARIPYLCSGLAGGILDFIAKLWVRLLD